ncbi:efflux RND transporter periplasmic adaptor subunit [Mangrovitalea sediminis]|uniref:efflux RND transporter periplasmic adaptor subunit n=1 Tax=Mangrovitalea sediminis TaxID=1982043 RepID=UPI000BE60430|nr:efflux RND transporter periplasmic adaptor subunit [Mangrovitalea sediminis]
MKFVFSPSLTGLFVALCLFGQVARADDVVSAKVKTVTLQVRTLTETIDTYGRVVPDPDSQSNIAVVHAGTIEKLMVRPGEQVSAGQALIQLATSPASRMDYQQAEANLKYAKAELARKQSLFSQHLVTQGDVASAQKDLKSAEAALQAQRRLGADTPTSILRSPFDGVVSKVAVSQGDRVQQDTTVVQVARREGMLVPLGVEQEDVSRLKPGQTVVLEPVFNPDLKIDSRIGQIHAMADPATGLVDVIVPVPAAQAAALIFNEMMRGHITLQQANSLAVPASAILDDRKGHYLFTVDHQGIAHKHYIQTGIQSDGYVGITGAVHAGDSVVITGNYELTDGMHVREVH